MIKINLKIVFSKNMHRIYIAENIENTLNIIKDDYTEEEINILKKKIENSINKLNDQKLEFRLESIDGIGKNFREIAYYTNIWKYGALHSSFL